MYWFVQSLGWQGSKRNGNFSWSKETAFSIHTYFLHLVRERGEKNSKDLLYILCYRGHQAKFMKPTVVKARIMIEQHGAARVAEGWYRHSWVWEAMFVCRRVFYIGYFHQRMIVVPCIVNMDTYISPLFYGAYDLVIPLRHTTSPKFYLIGMQFKCACFSAPR